MISAQASFVECTLVMFMLETFMQNEFVALRLFSVLLVLISFVMFCVCQSVLAGSLPLLDGQRGTGLFISATKQPCSSGSNLPHLFVCVR